MVGVAEKLGLVEVALLTEIIIIISISSSAHLRPCSGCAVLESFLICRKRLLLPAEVVYWTIMDQLLVVASTPVPSLINSSSATIATRIKASSSSLHLGSQLRALSGLDQSSSQAATARGLGAGTKAAATKKKKQQQLLLPSLYDHTCASPGYPFHAPLLVPSIMSPCCSSLQPPGAAPQRANVASVEVLAPPEGSADQAPASPKEEGQTPDDNKRIIAPRWRELHGSNDWKGLLQPLDEDLRAEIIRYGEFTEVTYDSFDSNPRSRFCGSNR